MLGYLSTWCKSKQRNIYTQRCSVQVSIDISLFVF
uniref:Uncharacterized protein n=1 Tax=Ciona intestinalis TaxID=7719 RepID=H2XJN6_CIOIN